MTRRSRQGLPGTRAPKAKYFKAPAELRGWLESHHESARELWVGYHKKGSGRPTMTWPESVDEALCYGWIDGIRRSVDHARYAIRFTPRRRGSNWSSVNVRRARALVRQGRMRPAGLREFDRRDRSRAQRLSHDHRPADLPAGYRALFRKSPRAWAFFQAQPPWYRKAAAWWVVSAKREETRRRRLERLVRDSAQGRTIPPLIRKPRSR